VATVHARGIDQLPASVTEPFHDSLVRQLEPAELSRAFHAAVHALFGEIRAVDADLAEALQPALMLLISNAA
jgi:hypothetical protein